MRSCGGTRFCGPNFVYMRDLRYSSCCEKPTYPSTSRTFSRMPLGEREKEFFRLLQEETERPFDLEHGPVLRATLFQLDDQSSDV